MLLARRQDGTIDPSWRTPAPHAHPQTNAYSGSCIVDEDDIYSFQSVFDHSCEKGAWTRKDIDEIKERCAYLADETPQPREVARAEAFGDEMAYEYGCDAYLGVDMIASFRQPIRDCLHHVSEWFAQNPAPPTEREIAAEIYSACAWCNPIHIAELIASFAVEEDRCQIEITFPANWLRGIAIEVKEAFPAAPAGSHGSIAMLIADYAIEDEEQPPPVVRKQ